MAGGLTPTGSAVCVASGDGTELGDAYSEALKPEPARLSSTEQRQSDPGFPCMTAAALRECCVRAGGYAEPGLNDVLMLQYKGFKAIENLAPYTSVRSLFLECNGITKLENLEALPNLISLYLQSNCIRRIEGLDQLPNLRYLNLANNSISVVENLGGATSLETLNLAQNKITEVQALAGLAERPSLRSVDVSGNYMEDGEQLMDFWPRSLPDLECLYLKNNPCWRTLKDYRRRMVSGLPRLKWLDERPVATLERTGSEAWAAGGKDAELEAKRSQIIKEQEEKSKSFALSRRIQQAGAERVRRQAEEFAARETAVASSACQSQVPEVAAGSWIQMPRHLETDLREPQRQAELAEKVQAFLCSKGLLAPRDAAAASQAEAAQTPTRAEATSDSEVAAEQAASSSGMASTVQAARAEALSAAASAEQAFVWSSFRDNRLGRLVANHRYDFSRTATALTEEFGTAVSADECRRRYREICRPSSAQFTMSLEEQKGRAKDAAPADPRAVQEVSDWFVRRVARGPQPQEGPIMPLRLTPSTAGPQPTLNDIDAAEHLSTSSSSAPASSSLGTSNTQLPQEGDEAQSESEGTDGTGVDTNLSQLDGLPCGDAGIEDALDAACSRIGLDAIGLQGLANQMPGAHEQVRQSGFAERHELFELD